MKKICVSMIVVYIVIMIFMAKSLLSQDILSITPIIVGVILIVYSGILLARESRLINDTSTDASIPMIDKQFTHIYNIRKNISYLRHDFANHAQVLMELVDVEKCPEKEKLITQIREELIDKSKLNYSDNEVLNLSLELVISKFIKDEYMVNDNISLYGLKEINVNVMANNIWMLTEIIRKNAKKSGNINIKLSIKENNQKKVIIAYKFEADKKEDLIKIEDKQEYKEFKEQLDMTGGTCICNVNDTSLVIGGWMEVLKNV